MGNTCKPMAVSFQCMTKFTTNKKKKLNIQKTNSMASGPITSQQIDGETTETVTVFTKKKKKESSLGHAKLEIPFSFPSGDGCCVEGI